MTLWRDVGTITDLESCRNELMSAQVDEIEHVPETHAALKQECLRRGGFSCILTGAYDLSLVDDGFGKAQ